MIIEMKNTGIEWMGEIPSQSENWVGKIPTLREAWNSYIAAVIALSSKNSDGFTCNKFFIFKQIIHARGGCPLH